MWSVTLECSSKMQQFDSLTVKQCSTMVKLRYTPLCVFNWEIYPSMRDMINGGICEWWQKWFKFHRMKIKIMRKFSSKQIYQQLPTRAYSSGWGNRTANIASGWRRWTSWIHLRMYLDKKKQEESYSKRLAAGCLKDLFRVRWWTHHIEWDKKKVLSA